MPLHDSELPQFKNNVAKPLPERRMKMWLLAAITFTALVTYAWSVGAFADETTTTTVTTSEVPSNGVEEHATDVAAAEEDAATLKASFFERASKAWDYAVNDTDGQLAEIAKREAEIAAQEADLAKREAELEQDMLVRSVDLNSAMGAAEITFNQLTGAVSALSKCVLQANDDLTRPVEPIVPTVAE